MGQKKIFRSRRTRKEHYFRIFEGWGLSIAVLSFLKRNYFDEVQLLIDKERAILISNVADWDEKGIPYSHPEHEAQRVLPERHMKRLVLTEGQLMEGTGRKP